MTNEELLALLKEGVEAWNEWRRKNPDELLDLSQINLGQVDLNLVNLSLANLSLANLSLTNLSLANLTQANLRWANLSQANLRWADLTYANLSLANLTQANLSQATLSHANLRWADLSQANLIGVELIGTDLSGANLSKTDFYKANLSGIDLTGTDLSGANFTEANLSGADLSGTDLREANLSRANLENANFTGANLTRANLVSAKALGANFAQATFTQACIEGWEVDRYTNLEGVMFDQLTTAKIEEQSFDLDSVTPTDAGLDALIFDPLIAAEDSPSLSPTDLTGSDRTTHRNGSHAGALIEPSAMDSRLPDLAFPIVPVPSPPPVTSSLTPDSSPSTDLELMFSHGINWQAFLLMVQALQQQYGDRPFIMQAIVQADDFALVVRLKASLDVEKDTLEAAATTLYATHLAAVEATYHNNLRLTDEQIAAYRQRSADLSEVVKHQAARPIVPVLAAKEQPPQHEEQAIADALAAYEPPVGRNDLEGWA